MKILRVCVLAVLLCLIGCRQTPIPPSLVERGEDVFFNETFDGNGRTCGTCHRAEDSFAISPAFIATLPPDDPLFVAETQAALARNFETPELMRPLAVILENQDGFNDLERNFNMRGVPHTLGLQTSIESSAGPRTGWSGDGSPGDGSLRSFATGAVIQHFTKTLDRVPGVDFRLPTEVELDALEAFQLSLGRSEDITLPLNLSDALAQRGQEVFMDRAVGKCNTCHFNAGANGDPGIFGSGGNLNFNTGIESLPDQPARILLPSVPSDDGSGTPGNGEFNTPSLIESADTAPFFHNNSVATLEGAVAFYNGAAFNESPAGLLLLGATGSGIDLAATQVEAVARFLRVLNVLENVRSSDDLIRRAQRHKDRDRADRLLQRAGFEIDDALRVLLEGGLHTEVQNTLADVAARVADLRKRSKRSMSYGEILAALAQVRRQIVGATS